MILWEDMLNVITGECIPLSCAVAVVTEEGEEDFPGSLSLWRRLYGLGPVYVLVGEGLGEGLGAVRYRPEGFQE